MQSSVEQELQFGGNPSPQSIVDFVKHARNPSNSTARAISETYCPPASAKHVTCHLMTKEKSSGVLGQWKSSRGKMTKEKKVQVSCDS
jgi:hypothetical protein